MSAFTMSNEFFNQLANEFAGRLQSSNNDLKWDLQNYFGMRQADFDVIDAEVTLRVQELFNANVSAVNQRYAGDDDIVNFVEAPRGAIKWSDVQLYKHLSCLHYQMAEGDVPKSNTYKNLSDLLGKIAQTLLSETAAYKESAWDYAESNSVMV